MKQNISVTVDVVIFAMEGSELKTLLVKRKYPPFKGKWAIPGGYVEASEDLEKAAIRELKEETGIAANYMEQLYTFGSPKRDPRGHTVTVSFMALFDHCPSPEAGSDAADSKWLNVYDLPKLAFDHDDIIEYALGRIRNKFEWTTASFSLVPEKFTLRQLQDVFEAVLDKELDKRNFRKKILALDLVDPTGEKQKIGVSRPAELYVYKKQSFEKLKDKGILFPF